MLLRRGVLMVFQGHPSNFMVTHLEKSSIFTQIGCFQTVTPVWIHQWLWNDAQSLKYHRRGALLFCKVLCHILRSQRFRTLTLVWIHQWLWNDAQHLKQHRRGALLFFKAWCNVEEVPYNFWGHPSKITRLVAAIKSLRFALWFDHCNVNVLIIVL